MLQALTKRHHRGCNIEFRVLRGKARIGGAKRGKARQSEARRSKAKRRFHGLKGSVSQGHRFESTSSRKREF